MGAEIGNRFWERRSQHGRAMLFSSPELMWLAACEYFENEDNDDSWKKREVASFQGTIVSEEFTVKTPYTWEGLCFYLRCATSYFRTFKVECKKKIADGVDVDVSKDFLAVIDDIEQVIINQQFKGAGSGHFNANIIARYLGLKDKQELSTPPEGEGGFNVSLDIK